MKVILTAIFLMFSFPKYLSSQVDIKKGVFSHVGLGHSLIGNHLDISLFNIDYNLEIGYQNQLLSGIGFPLLWKSGIGYNSTGFNLRNRSIHGDGPIQVKTSIDYIQVNVGLGSQFKNMSLFLTTGYKRNIGIESKAYNKNDEVILKKSGVVNTDGTFHEPGIRDHAISFSIQLDFDVNKFASIGFSPTVSKINQINFRPNFIYSFCIHTRVFLYRI